MITVRSAEMCAAKYGLRGPDSWGSRQSRLRRGKDVRTTTQKTQGISSMTVRAGQMVGVSRTENRICTRFAENGQHRVEERPGIVKGLTGRPLRLERNAERMHKMRLRE